jgi:exosortase B
MNFAKRRNYYAEQSHLIIIGLLPLVLLSFLSMFSFLWGQTDQEHGPIILFLFVWVVRGQLPLICSLDDQKVNTGWLLIIPALVFYVLGHSQQIWQFEIGSYIPLLAGVSLISKGWNSIKLLFFPFLFLLLAIPLPGTLVEMLTHVLKQYVSEMAEVILYNINYPIARSGVTLTIGSYQLLVADACSGFNSLFSLFAVGLFYIYLQNYKSKVRNICLVLAIIPIAVVANITRVIILVLLTYSGGDELGQGFLHGLAGIVLFAIALMTLFSLDKFLSIVFIRMPCK